MVFAAGRVQESKDNRYTIVKTPTAILRVWWAGGELPPDVYYGKPVAFMGVLVTSNGGVYHRIRGAVPFNKSYSHIMPAVRDYLWSHVDDPREYAIDGWLDKLSIEDIIGDDTS